MRAQATSSLLACLLLAGCQPGFEISDSTPSPSQSIQSASPAETIIPADTQSDQAQASPAAQPSDQGLSLLLNALVIEPEVSGGYDRDLFQHWIDSDADGCNTRREVLLLEAISEPVVSGRCEITGGTWFSQYDGVKTNDPGDFDIDHFVPLKEAWESGAYAWNSQTRKAFANDLGIPESLIAVSASSNRSKSDRDPAQWLPSNSGYLCEYTRAWLVVKFRWQLSIDANEALALGQLVASCPDTEVAKPDLASTAKASPKKESSTGEDPRFDSCREAKANGYGPYSEGIDVEYDWYRDGDSDGIVCE